MTNALRTYDESDTRSSLEGFFIADVKSLISGKLCNGVSIYIDSDNSCADRILLSEGTCPAAPFNRPDAKYFDVAYLPKEPWRTPTTGELNILTTNEVSSNYSMSISLIRVPPAILAPFAHLGLQRIQTREEYYDLMKQPSGTAAVDGVVKFVRDYMVKDDDFQVIRIFNRPGLVTATYVHDPKQDLFLGLHVDFTDKQSIFGRDSSANRISINLGQQDRHFLFINLSISKLIEILKPAPNIDPEKLVFDFLEAYPNYPVVKVRIQPGEAYIAPTQNLIHDGIGAKTTTDYNLTIIGHIALKPIQATSAPHFNVLG